MIDRINFEQVEMSFELTKLFDNLTLELRAGEVIAMTGANGSGKSTFLKLAGQFIRPDSGKIIPYDSGQVIEFKEFREKISAISPNTNLYPQLSAVENLNFFVKLRGKTIDKDEIDRLFERVGLDLNSKDKPFSKFSTGMQQRLKFAIMLATDSEVWLLDEPCSNLDEPGRNIFLDEIHSAASRNRLILIATNDENEARTADEIIHLPIM